MKPKPLVAEFVGTFTLIFIGVGAITADAMTKGALGLTGIALAHGLAIAVMVSAVGSISGGHFNPSVTVGALVAGKIAPLTAVGYIVAQCAGAIAAAAALGLALPSDALNKARYGVPAPGTNITSTEALVTEIVLTFFLMFVIYGTAIDNRGPKLVAGLIIGLAITADITMGGPISGAAMNPARWLGPALFATGNLPNFWIYWLGPIVGAVGAALVWRYFLESKSS